MQTEEEFIESLNPWSVFYFINNEVHSTVPHYFVIINKNISSCPVLVIPVSTTQIEKRTNYYKRHNFSDETLVRVHPEETNGILKKESIFDCSQTKTMDINIFYTLYQRGKLKYIWDMPINILEKLRKWVISTNQIDDWIKDLV